MPQYGDFNPALTKAINRVVAAGTEGVKFGPHSEDRMYERGFDHSDVLTCLRKGKAYGPEERDGDLRANMLHGGLHIRVAVGGLMGAAPDWVNLGSVVVVTVMELK